MIDYEYSDLFLQDSTEKQITISYGNTVITNEDLFNQEMTLEESLCSDGQLTFGSCEASCLKFKVANIFSSMKNQWLTVKMTLGTGADEPFVLGKYKVDSDKPTADRKRREIIAYDALYDIINADVMEWYNQIFPNTNNTVTIKQFRKSFLEYFDIEEEDISLVNDDEAIGKTWGQNELSGKTVISAICEINGCFGHIGRDGKFHYIYLIQGIQGLYPRNDIYPADNLYPRDPKGTPISKNFYISCTYEDFITGDIGKLQIINGDTGIMSVVGSGDNCYNIESNFLVAGKTEAELDRIGKRILSKISGVTYRPFDAECIGNPCFEVGDPVRLFTAYDIVETYILKRTLKGTQALKDSYSSDGVEKYEIKVNSTERAVGQLNDKTESLESDVETINEDIDNINENIGGIHVSLQKTDEGLEAEVSRATQAEGELSSRIQLTADSITAEVSRATQAEGELSSRIQLTAEEIRSEVSQTYETKDDADSSYSTLSSSIAQNAYSITTKVSKGDTVSEINQTSDTIRLSAGRLLIESGNFQLDSYGNITCIGGQIGGFSIGTSTLQNNSSTGLIACENAILQDVRIDKRLRVLSPGTAEFADAEVKGTLRAGTITGATIETINNNITNIKGDIGNIQSQIQQLQNDIAGLKK